MGKRNLKGPGSWTQSWCSHLQNMVVQTKLFSWTCFFWLVGFVRSVAQKREYGQSTLLLEGKHRFLDGIPKSSTAWMSHGDHVEEIGLDWDVLGRSDSGVIAAIGHRTNPWVAVQFHPEVAHTEYGEDLLRNFVVGMCEAPEEWNMGNFVAEQVSQLRMKLGSPEKSLYNLSYIYDEVIEIYKLYNYI